MTHLLIWQVGENIHPDEGYWIARQQMFWGGQRNENSPAWGDPPTAPTPDRERSVDYMHSTYIDNVLGGLLGIRGQTNASLVVSLADAEIVICCILLMVGVSMGNGRG